MKTNSKNKSVTAPLLALTLAGLFSQVLPAQTVISLKGLSPSSTELRHTGIPGQEYGLEVSSDLRSWEIIGPTTEMAGLFDVSDPGALYFDRRFYRIGTDYPPGSFAWQGFYAVSPMDGEEADPLPFFVWAPYPDGPVAYQLDIFPAWPDGDGRLALIPRPIYTARNLLGSFYELDDPALKLSPTSLYFYTISAQVGGNLLRGRPVLFRPHGTLEMANIDAAPLFLLTPAGTGRETDWVKLLELYNKLVAMKKELEEALKNNSLVQEAALLDQLAAILKNPEEIKAVLLAILEQRWSALSDPEQVIKALCYLEKLLNFVADHGSNLTDARKQALRQLAQRIAQIKARLEAANDKAQALQQAIQDLRELLNGTPQDLVQYILDAAKERLLEKIREMLVKKLGEKVAGSLISIVKDLADLTDAILKINSIESLCTEINRLLLEGIANDTKRPPGPQRRHRATVSERYLDCTLTLTYKKMCWKAKPGGGPNEGTWETSTVPFADGSESKTSPVSDLVDPDSFPRPGKVKIKWEHRLDPAALNCPPGAGPCLLYVEVVYRCPEGQSGYSLNLFLGVIKC